MKRRSFIGGAGSIVGISGSFAGCKTQKAEKEHSENKTVTLADYTFKQLHAHYMTYLFDDFIPYFDTYVIDREYGGFMYNTDRDGTHITTNKGAWYEGRGIWVYSFLYNEIAREQKYLDVARLSIDFIMKNKPKGEALFPATFTQEGTPVTGPAETLYGDLYIAAGLAEYAKAAGDPDMWNEAKDILAKCMRIYNNPGYNSIASDTDPVDGPRWQNVSMLILPVTTSLLKYRDDAETEAVAAEQVDAVCSRFYNPAYRLNNTILNHDYSRPENAHAQSVSFGVSIQTLWMILHEAVRLGKNELLETAVERVMRHIRVAWDDVYGGILSGLSHVDNNIWNLGKPLYNQAESLIALLAIIEHTGNRQAIELFSEIYMFTIKNYVQKDRGFTLWQDGGDRWVTFREHGSRAENFHHPRHLLLNLQALNRMIERDRVLRK